MSHSHWSFYLQNTSITSAYFGKNNINLKQFKINTYDRKICASNY